ncbi:MAG: ATP-binding protein [Pseudomonadota bacterium]
MKNKNSAQTSTINFQNILEKAPDLYLILDADFNIVAVGDAYLKQTMLKRQDIIGHNIFEILPDNSADKASTGVRNLRASLQWVLTEKVLDTMAVQKYEIRKPQELGGGFEERYWSPINSPVLDEDGKVEYIVHRISDVTDYIKHAQRVSGDLRIRLNEMEVEIYLRAQEIQEANKQLREANKLLAKKENEQKILTNKLEKFNQSKTQFFASVSHELRTPLTLILGILETLLADHELMSHQYNLKVIERNARALLKLVNDLLDVSKLEAGKIVLNYYNVDLVKLVRQTCGLFESYATERQIDFILETPGELVSEMDPEKIQRVLMNLLSNAFKFTPANGKVSCILSHPSVHIAKIVIADGGPGIPLKMRESIFERFFYVDEGSNRQFSGVSLGLAMVKDFVELHGGTINLNDGDEGGSVFTIELPLLAPPSVIIHPEVEAKSYLTESVPSFIHKLATSPKTNLRTSLREQHEQHLPLVLIVEDNIDVNQYICGVLSNDYRTESAYDGEEGLDKAKELHPDLILSDIMMPKMDGIRLISEIRKQLELTEVPIIVVSAKIDEELCVKLLSAGAQDYLAKPFSHAELRARVANLINLKKVRDDLMKKNDELTLANKELDAFSYSISHDLRNPLQGIVGFTTLLLDEYNFEGEALEYLTDILISSKRMEELISDLLNFSKAIRSNIEMGMTDLSVMAIEILAMFQSQHPERMVKIKVQDNMIAKCDPHLMKIALENLLGNAWKYSSKNHDAQIEFGIIPGPEAVYFVRDNGVGFDQTKADKLFIPFSRLHTEKDFPGTGIGLAIVKRIIERHGGHISVKSAQGEGTTFYMTLEKEKQKIGK